MKKIRMVGMLCVTLALVVSACAGTAAKEGISVQGAWVRAMTMGAMPNQPVTTPEAGAMPAGMGGSNSAGYMVLVNNTGQPDRLVKAESNISGAVEIHESKMVDGMMTMSPVEGGIELPAGGQAELKPGGFHIMFIGLKQDLKPGDKVSLTLYFEKAAPMTMEVEVKQP